jgi:hypothetical protein
MGMYFEGRELKPYAEPIEFDFLKEGSVYFSVTFIDEKMHIPQMEPFVVIGCGLSDTDTSDIYFQDVDSFEAGVRFNTATDADNANFLRISKNELSCIFEFDRALEVLMTCSLRRANAQGKL